MNKFLKIGLAFLLSIFCFLEINEFQKVSSTQLSSFQETNIFNQLNSLSNNEFVLREIEDIKFVNTTLTQLVSSSSSSSDVTSFISPQIRRRSGEPSIFVEGYTRIAQNKARGLNTLNLYTVDRETRVPIRTSSMLEAHFNCFNEFVKLPRPIEREDKKIIFGEPFRNLFFQRYNTFFKYSLVVEENVSETENKNKVKRAVKRLYKKKQVESINSIKTRLFENPCVIKLTKCRFRDIERYVTVYYDALTDDFAVVDSQNQILDLGIASEFNYADVYRYKSVFNKITEKESRDCQRLPIVGGIRGALCPDVDGSPSRQLPQLPGSAKSEDEFKKQRVVGLPSNYDPMLGWWLDREAEIARSLNSEALVQLSTERIYDEGRNEEKVIINDISQNEALIILQSAQAEFVSGEISRLKPTLNSLDRLMKLDFRVSSINRIIFRNFSGEPPFYVDIKAPLDPEVILARGESYQSLEDQIDFILNNIINQKERGKRNNASVLHIISLLRVKPADRAYFMENFSQKAALRNVGMSSIAFINTSTTSI